MGEFETVPRASLRLRIGIAVVVGSILIMGIGLFAVVSSLLADDANLPSEGSIENITESGKINLPWNENSVRPTWPEGPKPAKITIPRISVDGPVVEMGFEPGTNIPAVPKTGYETAWYDFNPVPGVGYNALFAGHVDWQTSSHSPIPGVFYRLRELKIGDDITITLEDGKVLQYRVTGNVAAKYDDPNVLKAMAPIQKDVITLLTCGGAWERNPSEENGGNYTHRIIVRAERIDDAAG